eukprot:3325101-Rhodomonas_salina.1
MQRDRLRGTSPRRASTCSRWLRVSGFGADGAVTVTLCAILVAGLCIIGPGVLWHTDSRVRWHDVNGGRRP